MIDLKYVTTKREPFFDLAKEFIRPDSKVLDIGAGNGYFAEYCNRSDFYLFDGNKINVLELQKKFPNSFYGRLPKLPFEKRFFDLIHCSHVIEHLNSLEVFNTLKEIDRCLKISGYVVISTPILWENFYNDLSHVRPYNPRLFLKYLCAHASKETILSNDVISNQFKLIKLQYRYREIPLMESYYNIKNNFFIKLLFKFTTILYSLGLRRYEKTGYTIILKKSN